MRPRTSLVLALCALAVACQSSASTSPSASETGSSSGTPSASAAPTPTATTAGDLPALVFDLGPNSAPIDVTSAFGSIWIANHHSDDVLRIDPDSGQELARMDIGGGSGPGYFAVTDDAIWVTRQNSTGMARIDPESNSVTAEHVGDLAPCGPAEAGLGAIWYLACDDGVMVRIDPATEEVTTVPAEHQSEPIVIDDVLYSASPNGLLRLTADQAGFEPVGPCCQGYPIGSAGGTVWLSGDDGALYRVDPQTGATVATIDLAGAGSMAEDDSGTVWLTVNNDQNLHRIDPSTNQELAPVKVGPSPAVVLIENGTCWVTDFGSSTLWRIELGG